MKKPNDEQQSFRGLRRNFLRIMRLCLFLVFVGTLTVHAETYSQSFDLKVNNASLEEVMNVIRSKTEYSFFFDDDAVSKISNITLDLRNATVEDMMLRCLDGTGFSFRVVDKTIILFREKTQSQVQNQRQHVVKGKVLDEIGNPMVGVAVIIKGTTTGTSTDAQGQFAVLSQSESGTLILSYVGYKNKEIAFKGQTDLQQIRMEVDVKSLDEVHVVAYGTTTRREATGAISVIKAEEFKDIPSSNIANLLQGRVAGMDVANLTGAPGGGDVSVTVRGYNSLDVEQGRRFSNPLWVVDGVPLNSFTSPITGTNLLSDLNPDMIESIQILKDASSAAIYGSRAANGVIIVTTKKGRENQDAIFSANVSHSWSILPRLPDVTIGREERMWRLKYMQNNFTAILDRTTNMYRHPTSWRDQYDLAGGSMDGFWYHNSNSIPQSNGHILQDSLNSFYNNSTNFFPAYFEVGKVTNANIQTYGGSSRMSYGIGMGLYNETGVWKGTGFKRVDLNSNMRVTPVKRLYVDLRFNASIVNKKRANSGAMGNLDQEGQLPLETIPGNPYSMSTLMPGRNSVVWDELLKLYGGTKETNRTVRLRANFRLGYQITEALELTSSLATDYAISRRNYFTPSYLDEDYNRAKSLGETGINLMVLNENLLSYKKSFGDGHGISAVAGFSYQYDQAEYNGGSAIGSPSDKIYYAPKELPPVKIEQVGSYTSVTSFKDYVSDMQEKSLMSYFGRLEYNYKQKYLFSLSIRRDGSSTFGENNRWGTFPSVAGGWNFSEESFIRDAMPWISFGKLRASWGRSGMHFFQNYLALGIMKVGTDSYLGNGILEPVYPDGLYNPTLSWEETDQYDFGLDLDLFDYRLSITADYYYRYTDQLLDKVTLPGGGHHTGYVQQWRNSAAIANEGIEILVRYDVIRNDKVYWKVSMNLARNWNRFVKSYTGKDLDDKRIIGKPLNGIFALKTDGFINSQDEVPVYYTQQGVGYPLSPNTSYSYHFKPGDYKFVDVNGDRRINSYDRVYCGSALPEFSGGIVSELRWNNFDMNVLFSYQLGRHMVNTAAYSYLPQKEGPYITDNIDGIRFWGKEGSDPEYPMYQGDNGAFLWGYTDRQVEKVNWIKLKTLTLGYSFNQPWVKEAGLSEVRLFASGENLFTITNYSGIDPETVDIRNGIDTALAYPLARKFTIGLTLKF